MERHKISKEVGNGTFGSVWRALNKESGEVVAIKKMKKKYYSWEECINLREVKSLRKMNHPNIVKLKEVIRESDVLYFVFEYMECNLYQLMKDRRCYFTEAEVRSWCFQVFQGLAYIHQRGYFHRDLKPENLLVSKDIIKIADFGLAREINSQPPFTEYVSTRWYRAPEVLLQSPTYGPPVDMWAMGAIMAELFTLRPLFPGSSEADEIYKICCVIGSPTKSEWAEGLELASALNYQFPRVAGIHLSALVPGVSNDAINLIKSLCSWDPCKRPSALEALQHPFFKTCYYVPPSLRCKPAIIRTPLTAGTRGALEQNCDRRYMGCLSYPKPTDSFSSARPQPYMVAGVQRKLDMNNQVDTFNLYPGVQRKLDMNNQVDTFNLYPGGQRKLDMNNQDSTKIDKNMNYAKPQPKYRPPVLNCPPAVVNMGKTPKAAEKLANLTMESSSPLAHVALPTPIKAQAWHGQSELFPKLSQEFIPGRAAAYNRKVAG